MTIQWSQGDAGIFRNAVCDTPTHPPRVQGVQGVGCGVWGGGWRVYELVGWRVEGGGWRASLSLRSRPSPFRRVGKIPLVYCNRQTSQASTIYLLRNFKPISKHNTSIQSPVDSHRVVLEGSPRKAQPQIPMLRPQIRSA